MIKSVTIYMPTGEERKLSVGEDACGRKIGTITPGVHSVAIYDVHGCEIETYRLMPFSTQSSGDTE